MWEELVREVEELDKLSTKHFNDWKETEQFSYDALTSHKIKGIHSFYHANIYEAVY